MPPSHPQAFTWNANVASFFVPNMANIDAIAGIFKMFTQSMGKWFNLYARIQPIQLLEWDRYDKRAIECMICYSPWKTTIFLRSLFPIESPKVCQFCLPYSYLRMSATPLREILFDFKLALTESRLFSRRLSDGFLSAFSHQPKISRFPWKKLENFTSVFQK